MKEVVVDTNVLVSALITFHGTPRKILIKIASGHLGLLISPRMLFEVISVFSRPKFRVLIPERKVSDLVDLIHRSARIVKPNITINACRDSKDNLVLECGVAGKAAAIISGDADLLTLNPFRGIPIVTPREFLSSIK